jgi:hypothetical protein
MKRELTAKQYCVEVTYEEFVKLTDKEFDYQNNNDFDTTLYNELEKINGVNNVDYNGHFGPNIFYIMEEDYASKETDEKIKKIITKWIS